ncbi:MAG: hypothetical protein CMJ19_04960 [Phycisphaeraceae bacterium]|nr:hypothetical protein [Phycisphaeraceae bacterium]
MKSPPCPADRRGHGINLQFALDSVPDHHRAFVQAAGVDADEILDAYYLTFQIDSLTAFDVSTLAPYANKSGIRILATRKVTIKPDMTAYEIAVFVPAKEIRRFQKKVAEYLGSVNQDKPKVYKQIDRWRSVDLTSIKQFWTDRSPFPSDDETIWWEVWLRYEDKSNPLVSLRDYCEKFGIAVAPKGLVIDDRLVILAKATPLQWSTAPLIVAYLAEFRRARELATPFLRMKDNNEQRDWANDLANRLLLMGTNLPAVCVVDSGVNRAHPLLEASLAETDQYTCDSVWGVDDVAARGYLGHGTGMAGLALFGQYLPDLLESSKDVQLHHILESVKILPRVGGNAPDLYGVRTVEATTGPETTAPKRNRIFLLALTADNSEDSGEPSLWAATVDALAVGRSVYPDADTDRLEHLSDKPETSETRLWVVSGGNVRDGYVEDHLALSDNHAVQNPSEAWNAITVGAMTELCIIKNPDEAQTPLADYGQLSPLSRTSVIFDSDRPIKPEIVMEGGNAHTNSNGRIDIGHDDLSLLTTSQNLLFEQFTTFNGTSAASALVARVAAKIWADYPNLWPETVRGLLIHSARWTDAMKQQLDHERKKSDRLRLLRRYGWGVPDEDRALRCLGNKLTLICQDEFQPYANGQYNQMCLHSLPWPIQTLQDLSDETVNIRITLSTFIDPHPSRRGRYGYPSHQLRFELKRSTDTQESFLKRINAADRESDTKYQSLGPNGDSKWFFGPDARSRGSVFSDIWSGTAAELATRDQLVVFPVSGWWKDKKLAHKTRYSLIISIETEKQETDLWAEIVQAVEAMGITVPIEI